MRIVIIDDAQELAELAADVLRQRGHDVEVVTHDFGALAEAWRWADVDVALIDYVLGDGVTGVDGWRWLTEHAPNVKVVVMSGHERPDDCPDDVPWLIKGREWFGDVITAVEAA